VRTVFVSWCFQQRSIAPGCKRYIRRLHVLVNQAALDTVNRTARSFVHAKQRKHESRSLAHTVDMFRFDL
jgi:hypothetical protein